VGKELAWFAGGYALLGDNMQHFPYITKQAN